MSDFNILFTSVGRRVSLVRAFKKALDDLGLIGQIVTTDLKKSSPASFIADFRYQLPPVNDPSYISRLLDVCQKHHIKLLIPLIDSELSILAAFKQDFADLGVHVLVSSLETNEICFDKRKTYYFFRQNGISTPEVFDRDVFLNNPQTKYPLLIKPANGSSSVGVTKIENAEELEFFRDYIAEALIQEFVVGQEYTLDVLVDLDGVVRSVVPRLRIETRAGEVSKGMTVKNQMIIAAGKKVVDVLPNAVGCITVQCFLLSDGDIKFIEINPRFGGGFPLSFQAGAYFPHWIVQMLLGKDLSIKIDEWQDGLVMLRYDDEVFVTKDMIT